MKTNYFENCKSVEELKKAYRQLVLIHHPDNGGNIETIKIINVEYDNLFNILKNAHDTERPEDFRNIIEKLMKLNGLTIEICGSWIWLSGNTYEHKNTIKEMGFKWANKKKMWYLGEMQRKNKKGALSMNTIRNKYGSEIYNSEQVLQLT